MDNIYLNGMEFYGYHGVFPEETKLGQIFIVDLQVSADLKEAGRNDDLAVTINYAEAYEIVKTIVEGKPKKLIEAVGEEIANAILKQFPGVSYCIVKVTKPNPPIHGHLKSVAIEIKRSRDE